MKICNGPEKQAIRRILLAACVSALAAAFTVALPRPAHAHRITPPPVPANIQAPAGSKAFFEGSRRRHPELHLPAINDRRRLDPLRPAGHLVRRR